jgi:hypothetical protein
MGSDVVCQPSKVHRVGGKEWREVNYEQEDPSQVCQKPTASNDLVQCGKNDDARVQGTVKKKRP